MSPVHSIQPMSRLLGPNEVFVADSVMTAEEQSVFVRWADRKREGGRLLVNPVDSRLYMTPFRAAGGELTRLRRRGDSAIREEALDPLPDEFWEIRTRVVDLLGIHDLEDDPYKGSFLTLIAPGGKVPEHRDVRLRIDGEEFLVLRCNVLFNRPRQGGLPSISSREFDVCAGGMWAFYPTELAHSAAEVRGSECRGSLSFGFLVRPTDLWQRRFRITPGVELEFGEDESGGETRRALIVTQCERRRVIPIREHQARATRSIMSQAGDFSVQEAAQAVNEDPAEVWEVIRDLQSLNLLQSESSAHANRGKVLLL